MQPVLDRLAFWYDLAPDPRAVSVRIDDAVLANAEVILAQPEVAPVVVPGRETLGWRLEHISQSLSPEPGELVRIGAVDDELEARHQDIVLRAQHEGAGGSTRRGGRGEGRAGQSTAASAPNRSHIPAGLRLLLPRHHCHLGPLAVHIDTDVDSARTLFPSSYPGKGPEPHRARCGAAHLG